MPRAEPAAAPRQRFAAAKINLALHVVGRRDDGYHRLDMLVAFADIGDRVVWTPGGDCCRLEVEDGLNRPEPVPVGTANLAWRALSLAGSRGAPLSGTLRVVKDLPSGAGIGGGSSDAAATLRAVLGDAAANRADLAAASLALGADLPVCLAGTPSRVRGIGEAIEPIALTGPLPVVLVWPGAGLSTPAVFGARHGGFGAPIPDTAIASLPEDPIAAIAGLRNDLAEAAVSLLPSVDRAAAALEACRGCRLSRMSGSGSTVVGYFDSADDAQAAAASIAAANPAWWVRRGSILAGGPAVS